MVEVDPEAKLSADWLLLSREERLRVSVLRALEFFYPHDFPPSLKVLESIPVRQAVDMVLEENRTDLDRQSLRLAFECILALHLPARLLELMRYGSAYAPRGLLENLIQEFVDRTMTPGYPEDISLAKAIESFWSKLVPQLPVDAGDAIRKSTRALTRDPYYVGFRAVQTRAINAQQQNELRREISEEAPHTDRVPTSVDRYRRSVAKRANVQEIVEANYSLLSFREAIAVRGIDGFAAGLVGCLTTLFLLVSTISRSPLSPISVAFAQTSNPIKSTSTLPLNLPLSVWVPMVIGFYVFLLVVLIVFLWKGYLAKSKSDKAAAFIDRFGTLALGVFLGKVSGL
jgi:hypothetical protein